MFLPPSDTSELQLIDQGVMEGLQTLQKLQVIQMLENIDNGEDTKSISVLDAILMISAAWEKITETTFVKCFCHADFKDLSLSQEEYDDNIPLARTINSSTDEDDNVP